MKFLEKFIKIFNIIFNSTVCVRILFNVYATCLTLQKLKSLFPKAIIDLIMIGTYIYYFF